MRENQSPTTGPEDGHAVVGPATASPTPSCESFIARFDHTASRQLDAPSLIFGSEQYRYRDLQSWSVLIAADIEDRLGAGTEPVATLIGHHSAVVAAMLASRERVVHL